MAYDTGKRMNPGTDRIVRRLRKAWFFGGLTMIGLGLAALLLPTLSSLVIGILIGWLLFLSGVIAVAWAFSVRGTGLFVWQLVAGLGPLLAGALLIVFPEQGLIALTLLVGLVLLLTGVAQSSFALWVRPVSGWGWGMISAVISIALGVYILVMLPVASAVILGILVGIDFLSTGVAMVLIAQSAGSRPVI